MARKISTLADLDALLESPDRMRAKAYHEAAHAVVGMSIGCEVEYAEIEGFANSGGCVLFVEGHGADDAGPATDVKTTIAGPVAELIATGNTCPTWPWTHDGNLIAKALESAFPDADENRKRLGFIRFALETVRIVHERWGEIDRLARALIDRLFLTGEQVEEILRGPVRPSVRKSKDEHDSDSQ